MTAPTEPDLQAIAQRCEAATDGPWQTSGVRTRLSGARQQWLRITDASGSAWAYVPYSDLTAEEHAQSHADQQFIAHARQDIPALLSHIKAQQSEIEALEEEVGLCDITIEAHNEYILALTRRAEAAEAEVETLKATTLSLRQDSARFMGERNAAEAENAQLKTDLDELSEEVRVLREREEAREAELERVRADPSFQEMFLEHRKRVIEKQDKGQ